MYISKKSEIQLELEAEDNAMTTIHQAIIDHGGVAKWVEIISLSHNEIYNIFLRMEKNFVKLEEYEKALYIKNGLDILNVEK